LKYWSFIDDACEANGNARQFCQVKKPVKAVFPLVVKMYIKQASVKVTFKYLGCSEKDDHSKVKPGE